MTSDTPPWEPEALRLVRLLNDVVLPLAGYGDCDEETKQDFCLWNWVHPPSDLNKHFLLKWDAKFFAHAAVSSPVMYSVTTGEPVPIIQFSENGELCTRERYEADRAAMQTEAKREQDEMVAAIQLRNNEVKALAAQHNTTAHDIYLYLNKRARQFCKGGCRHG